MIIKIEAVTAYYEYVVIGAGELDVYDGPGIEEVAKPMGKEGTHVIYVNVTNVSYIVFIGFFLQAEDGIRVSDM
nr:hypothetical protein [Staphylococcus haemolyticus]